MGTNVPKQVSGRMSYSKDTLLLQHVKARISLLNQERLCLWGCCSPEPTLCLLCKILQASLEESGSAL